MNSDTDVDIEIKKRKVRIRITLILGLLLSVICGTFLIHIFSARGEGDIYFNASNGCTVQEEIGATIQNLPYESLRFLYSEGLNVSIEYHPGKLIPSKCGNFDFVFSTKPSNFVIELTSYNLETQKRLNPIGKDIKTYIKVSEDGYYNLELPLDLIQRIVGEEFFKNTEKYASPFKFVVSFDDVVREPTFSRRTMYGTLITNNPTFERISLNLPSGARPLPFSPISHWTPSGFRHSNPKFWKEFDGFSILANDKQTNMSVAFDFPDKERLEKTLLVVLSTLFGVGISAMIEAFLSLGTAGIVGVLARNPEKAELGNNSNEEPKQS